uniref:Uncharacterized protein n=1 Tax=Gadus morhua TaxID=8049 RepID=A0A8C4Z0I2_GADMO
MSTWVRCHGDPSCLSMATTFQRACPSATLLGGCVCVLCLCVAMCVSVSFSVGCRSSRLCLIVALKIISNYADLLCVLYVCRLCLVISCLCCFMLRACSFVLHFIVYLLCCVLVIGCVVTFTLCLSVSCCVFFRLCYIVYLLCRSPVFDDMSGPIKSLRYLSQSTDSLSRTKPVTESLESLIDEGTEMEERQLMEDLEAEVKELEADSWTFTVDQSLLDTLTKDQTKRQDVIYELMQTEMHHVRTLRIMSEVYGKGLLRDAQLEQAAVDRMFPGLDDLLEIHTLFLTLLLDRRERRAGPDAVEGGAVVHRVGDLLLGQFSGASGELMKRVYGRFCGCHNEAVNFYKDLLNKDKHFQVSVKVRMSSSVVRRLGIPECILLVTQRITKYPVLIQRILQYTDESEEEHGELSQALTTVKEVLAAVDTRVNEKEKRRRLEDVHARMESKSITRMRSGQMFAREDLIRGRRLLREGALQLKNSQGRMKDVIALLLSDVFVFLQEKDQKYAFASLDQRSTVLSLHNLIVREVANEERGIFLISAGADRPEMLEVVAGSKEERNTWMQLIQDAMNAV